MAMIKCSECGKDISDKAAVCIGCGAPISHAEPDTEKALGALQVAASQGNAIAQRLLGKKYEQGDGVPIDYESAVHWYRQAAEQGDAEAQNNLGLMCMNGYVVVDGVHVGDVSGDGKVDYEDFKLAVSHSEKFATSNVEEAVNFGERTLQSAKKEDAAILANLANNSGPVITTESQISRDKFKAAMETTISIKFADILRTKTGTDMYLTYFDAQIMTNSVRNVFKSILQLVPAQVETSLLVCEAVLAPSTQEKVRLLKNAKAIGGGTAGIGIIIAAIASALGVGAPAGAGIIAFFTGANVLGPIAWGVTGLAIVAVAGYFATTSNNQTDSERFLKVLKESTAKAVDTIWEEHGVALSKVLSTGTKF